MKVKLYKPFENWYHGGVIWVYSDPHFDDPDCPLMSKNWPTPEEQVKIINSKVGKNDTLIILGDVGNIEWVKKLKGYKVLIMGNHDKGASNYLRKEEPVEIIGDELEILNRDAHRLSIRPGLQFNHDRFKKYKHIIYNNDGTSFCGIVDNHLFDEVYEGPLFISDKILLSHEPIDIQFGYNIHGHKHDGEKSIDRAMTWAHFNVCSNVRDFTPIRLDEIVSQFKVEDIHRGTIDRATERSKKKKKC